MISLVALFVFVIGLFMVYWPASKFSELGKAMLWVGLAILVWFLAGWHAVNL